jgi:hypothetical protein
VEVVEVDPRGLQLLVEAAEEVGVLGHAQVGEEVLLEKQKTAFYSADMPKIPALYD